MQLHPQGSSSHRVSAALQGRGKDGWGLEQACMRCKEQPRTGRLPGQVQQGEARSPAGTQPPVTCASTDKQQHSWEAMASGQGVIATNSDHV